MVVFKYPFSIDPVQSVLDIAVRGSGEVVLFDIQDRAPTLWLEVEPGDEAPVQNRTFVLFGTGHELPDDKKLMHVGSAIGFEGRLVLHCYEDIT